MAAPSTDEPVSTHSRLKAAGFATLVVHTDEAGFNTQPPKGGWLIAHVFQQRITVSTHSRLKAAGGT